MQLRSNYVFSLVNVWTVESIRLISFDMRWRRGNSQETIERFESIGSLLLKMHG